ncbi:MAG: asparaginase [Candidatus Limnocylindria bacterium]
MTDERRRVALILTGGTIDSVGVDRLDLAWYIEADKRLPPGDMRAQIPELDQIARVEEVAFRRLPSHGLVVKDWLDLVRLIHEIFDADRADGLVITHGTNTLEETAYFLNLVLKTDRPVVLAGSMRPASGLSADGPLNLLNAVRVAAAPSSRGRGVLVVLNDTIHAGRDVKKTATYRVQTFGGGDLGPLGFADADGRVVFYHRTERRHTVDTEFDVRGLDALPRVDVVVSYVGADGTMIDAAVAAGAKGIVSAGTGAGRPTPLEDKALTRAHEAGVLVCQSTRVGSGRVVRAPALVRRGFVAADNLVPWKARALLSLALVHTKDPTEIQRMFDEY